jgi:hypothetical protein
MSIGTQIIEDALKVGGVLSVAVPSSPEQITDGLTRLNSLLNLWLSYGIKFNFNPITQPGEDLDEPIDVTSALVDNLWIMMAPYYSKPVTPDQKSNARRGLADVKTLYQEVSIPDKVVSSTLPTGAGQSKGTDPRVFFPKGGTLNG